MTHLIYPTTNFKAIEQITIERGEGCYVWDKDGKQYLEGLAGLWCTALGYGNQELIMLGLQQNLLLKKGLMKKINQKIY